MSSLFDDLPEHQAPAEAARGAARLRRAERRQVELRPLALDELIGPDHLARAVWHMVERFDLTPLLDRIEARDGTPGHPPADPAILVALWLYATLDGVGSARALARLCTEHVAYRWIAGGVSTNHHALSDFRVRHVDWLDRELARSLTGLLAAGVISVQTVAQDGLRVRASAGGSSFRREPRLRQFARLAAARVAGLKAELEHDPAAQDRRRTAAQARAARERAERVEAALAAMPEARARKRRNQGKQDEARVSTTDPEARVMRMPDGGFRPAYTVQFAAEAEHGLVVGVAVDVSGADQDALAPMHRAVCARLGRVPAHWLTDAGFVSKGGIVAVEAGGSALHAPLGTALSGADEGPLIARWRDRMGTPEGRQRYGLRGRTIEWVNACARNRGLVALRVRGAVKARAVALWHALAHNVGRIIRTPALAAAAC